MTLKRFFPYFAYLKPVRLQFGIGIGFGILNGAASGAGLPFVIYYLIPALTSENKHEGLSLFLMLGLIPLVFTLRALGEFMSSYFNAYSGCLLYTSPSPRDGATSRMPSSA